MEHQTLNAVPGGITIVHGMQQCSCMCIQKAVYKEANVNNYMIMKTERTTRHSPHAENARHPQAPQINKEECRKLRPDLVMITCMLANENPTHGTKLHIYMVEVGYCPNPNHDVKIKEKEKQHAQLLAILTEAGHTIR